MEQDLEYIQRLQEEQEQEQEQLTNELVFDEQQTYEPPEMIGQYYTFVDGVPDWVFWLLIAIVSLAIIAVIVIFAVPSIRNYVLPYDGKEYYVPNGQTSTLPVTDEFVPKYTTSNLDGNPRYLDTIADYGTMPPLPPGPGNMPPLPVGPGNMPPLPRVPVPTLTPSTTIPPMSDILGVPA